LTERLLLATTNIGKTREMQACLRDLDLETLSLEALGNIEPFPERGRTFSENARGKSLFYSRHWDGLTLGEDSGLEIDHLAGAPGVLSARFSGPDATDETNLRKVLRLLEGVPAEERTARFVSCMALSRGGRVIFEIQECAAGRVLDHKRGRSGFGYDPIFYYPPLRRTFAELEPAEKNRVSHRGQALCRLRDYLLSVNVG
jgi:XTP/dITP diphosphohydrolase